MLGHPEEDKKKPMDSLSSVVAHYSSTTTSQTPTKHAHLDRLVLPGATMGKGAGDLNHAGGNAIWGQLPALQVLGGGHAGLDTLQHAHGGRGGSVYSIGRVHPNDGGGDVCVVYGGYGGCVREDRGGRTSRQKERWIEQLGSSGGTHRGRGHGTQATSSCQGKHGGPVGVYVGNVVGFCCVAVVLWCWPKSRPFDSGDTVT